jgi:hypothetical protein
MTTYMNVDAAHRRVEIGLTWHAQSAQRTGINTESAAAAKSCSIILGCIAVEFRTNYMNLQSRAVTSVWGETGRHPAQSLSAWPMAAQATRLFSIIDEGV